MIYNVDDDTIYLQLLQRAPSASFAVQTVDVYIAGLYATVKMTAMTRVMSSIAVCCVYRMQCKNRPRDFDF